MPSSRFDPVFVERFIARIDKTGDCWMWTGSRTKAGYGQLQYRRVSQQPLLAHRVAWELRFGSAPGKLHVLHHCDNPACVRPEHLFLGTQKDNNTDRTRKGRTASGDRNGARTQPKKNPFVRNRGSGLLGEKHPQAKLSNAEVDDLLQRFAAGENRSGLAREFGISVTHVYRLGRAARRS